MSADSVDVPLALTYSHVHPEGLIEMSALTAATVARSHGSAPLEVNAHHHPLGLTAVMHRVTCASPSALSQMNGARRGMA